MESWPTASSPRVHPFVMRRSCLVALGAFVLGGCTGTVNGGSPSPAPDESTGGVSGSGPGTGGSSGQAPTGAGGQAAAGGGQQPMGGQGGATPAGGAAGAGVRSPPVLDAGRVVLRRLNRAEYDNTVRDLLGTSLRPADKLPNDETAAGFDTVGEALSLTLAHLEVLEQGATDLVDELFALPVANSRRTSVLVCDLASASEDCSRQVLTAFARRAFRRPVVDSDITPLVALVQRARDAGNSYEEALRAALRAVLLSPHFLYMVERSAPGSGGAALPVNDHELATRLSYFLWSSMPDAELSAQADAGTLTRDAAALQVAVGRMLSAPNASALTENFAGQWLTLRRLPLVVPDPQTFPSYDVALRDAAVEETERFVQALLAENAPVETLLTADFTFVNQALGSFYGLTTTGPDFQRVSLVGTDRVGILGQMSFLMQTSHPSFTSPTKRGVWVLEQLLCSPPDPPPGDLMIEPLDEPAGGQTVRQALAQHREDPKCAGCHAIMDPIGLGLENFDAIGAYRAVEKGMPVDASGTLEEVPFVGARELSSLLAADARVSSCTMQQLLTYAVGRPFEAPDAHAYAAALVAEARAGARSGFRDLIETVVGSEAFRTRRGE
jgi:hypothetical protein